MQLLLPEEFAADGLHVWAFAASVNGEVSPTAYAAARMSEYSGYSEHNAPVEALQRLPLNNPTPESGEHVHTILQAGSPVSAP